MLKKKKNNSVTFDGKVSFKFENEPHYIFVFSGDNNYKHLDIMYN